MEQYKNPDKSESRRTASVRLMARGTEDRMEKARTETGRGWGRLGEALEKNKRECQGNFQKRLKGDHKGKDSTMLAKRA